MSVSTRGDSPAIRWSAQTDSGDAFVLHDDAAYLVGGERASAWNLDNGDCLWEVEAPDTSGDTDATIVGRELVLLPEYDDIVAFDLGTGALRSVDTAPTAVTHPGAYPDLPGGYVIERSDRPLVAQSRRTFLQSRVRDTHCTRLSYEGNLIWEFDDWDWPFVARFGGQTIIVGRREAVVVVDSGEQTFALKSGQDAYAAKLRTRANAAFVLMTDAKLHRVDFALE